ncbi:MAG: hypothetical protein AVDCRST_MAG27-4183, partial [uncultured Craurococcus sp.]
ACRVQASRNRGRARISRPISSSPHALLCRGGVPADRRHRSRAPCRPRRFQPAGSGRRGGRASPAHPAPPAQRPPAL